MNLLEEIGAETAVIALEDKLREATHQLAHAFNQNEKLLNALYDSRRRTASCSTRSRLACSKAGGGAALKSEPRRRCRRSPTQSSSHSSARSWPSRTPSECRTLTPSITRRTSSRLPRASSSTYRPE